VSGQRVLVVDDEQQILRALRTSLRGAGYEVDAAETAETALAAAAMRPPDAVILDLVLPDGTGIEVCRELRTWSSAPVILLSAVGEERELIFEPFHRGARSAGAAGAGLGLAIARGFAEANGGRVAVESRAGQGATFVLSLPAVRTEVLV
jgi:CheY-like chemotaxis protein